MYINFNGTKKFFESVSRSIFIGAVIVFVIGGVVAVALWELIPYIWSHIAWIN